jgi:hypothetical protein
VDSDEITGPPCPSAPHPDSESVTKLNAIIIVTVKLQWKRLGEIAFLCITNTPLKFRWIRDKYVRNTDVVCWVSKGYA